MLGQGVVICDLQSDHVRAHTIGAYFVVEDLAIFATGVVEHDPETGYTFRNPKTWLSQHMMDRMVGVPIVLIDPDDETNVPDFPANVVGTVLSARAENGKCLATVRIISQALADLLAEAKDLTIECELNILPSETNAETETDFDSITTEPVPRLVNFITMALVNGDE